MRIRQYTDAGELPRGEWKSTSDDILKEVDLLLEQYGLEVVIIDDYSDFTILKRTKKAKIRDTRKVLLEKIQANDKKTDAKLKRIMRHKEQQ